MRPSRAKGITPRIECPACGREVSVNKNGQIYGHLTMRMSYNGPYLGEDSCPGGAWVIGALALRDKM